VGFKVVSEGSDARDAVIHHFDESRGSGFACVELAPGRGHLSAPPRNCKVHHRMVAKILTIRFVEQTYVETIPVIGRKLGSIVQPVNKVVLFRSLRSCWLLKNLITNFSRIKR